MDKQTKAKAEQERSELRRIINDGISFEVEVRTARRPSGIFGRFKRKQISKQKRVFKVSEPTLATLDRLSALWLSIDIDDTQLTNDNYLADARRLAAQHSQTLAEIVATAVLGEDLYDITDRRGVFAYKPNNRKLAELSTTFFHSVKPSDLFKLAILITNACNLADFIASMRLMSATRTSEPMATRIEPQD